MAEHLDAVLDGIIVFAFVLYAWLDNRGRKPGPYCIRCMGPCDQRKP